MDIIREIGCIQDFKRAFTIMVWLYYSGSINANNFNDEGQERGFWIHSFKESVLGQEGMVLT